jgi:hypothetical protein
MSRSLRSLFLGCLATGLLTASVTAQAELVNNGGFETGDFTGWTTTNTDPNFYFSGVDQSNPRSGLSAAYFGNLRQDRATISQTLITVPGTSYTVSYYLSSEDLGGGTMPNGFLSTFGGATIESLSDIAASAYTLHSFTLTASSAATLLSFSLFDEPGFLDLDDISVLAVAAPPVTVPEPTSIALLALAGTAAVLQGRRRKTGRTA